MDLLLDVRILLARTARLEVRARLPPDTTVAALVAALADHASARGLAVDGAVRAWDAEGRALRAEDTVTEAGLCPGATLVLATWAPDPVGDAVAPMRAEALGADGAVAYNRTPHRPVVVTDRVLDELAPPAGGTTARTVQLTSVIVPVVTGIGFAVVLGRPRFLLIALLAPLALLAVSGWQRRQGRRSHRADRVAFEQDVAAALDAAVRALEAERLEREQALPAAGSLVRAAEAREPILWGRAPDAPDWLRCRLGLGEDSSRVRIPIAAGGEEALRADTWARVAEVETISGAPVPLDLSRLAIAAMVGRGDLAAGLARSLLAQVVVRQAPEDVVLAAVVGPDSVAAHAWLRWLPHTRASSSPLEGPHLAATSQGATELVGALVELAAGRAAAGQGSPPSPAVVVLVGHDAPVDPAVLGRLLDLAPDANVQVLWVGPDVALVPRQCRATVVVERAAAQLTTTDPDEPPRHLVPELLDEAGADRLGRGLAPVRDTSTVARAAALPRVVGLTEVAGVGAVDEVAARWEAAGASTLEAPIGVGPEGPFVVDLVAQGPHALLAGTSGAGKSELLTTMVASLAARYPPERLTILFVDYKGGAAAAPFADLPHNVGVVTNLDAVMSHRALVSLRAELDRRMALLADRAKDLVEFAQVAPQECPPRLVIVVDEFATLVKEIPDFVAGMVDIAQRGRSLGIHLVLATQRPAGAVSENILANTNLRIALRVVDSADSLNVIGTADAAEIGVSLRGRALARVGPGDLVPFQSAWAGAPRGARGEEVLVEDLVFGAPGTGRRAGGAGRELEGPAQLDEVLDTIVSAQRRRDAPRPRAPWCPPLPEVVPAAGLSASGLSASGLSASGLSASELPAHAVRIGLADRPELQRVEVATVDLEADGGLVVFGTGGTGRSTVLRTVAHDLASRQHPEDVVLVAFDFASRGLLALDALPHTRVVATADDLEAVARTVDWMTDEVGGRRRLLGTARAESWSGLRGRPGIVRPPRLVALIDGYGALRETLEAPSSFEWFQRLNRTLIDGRQVGIHAVITADRRSELPAPVLGSLGARLVLRLGEPEEMASVGVPIGLARGATLPPGRGFLGATVPVQVAVAGDGPSGQEQADAIRSLGAAHRADGVGAADRDAGLPDAAPRPRGTGELSGVVVGIADGEGPARVDVAGGHVAVVGPPRSGRSTALLALADALAHDPPPREQPRPRLVGLGGPRSPLAEHRGLDVGAFEPDAVARVVNELVDDLVPDDRVAAVVLVDDADDVAAPGVDAALERLAGRKDVRVVPALDPGTLARGFGGWVAAVRRGRRVLHLCPDTAAEVDQTSGARLRFRPGSTFPPGRGVLVTDRQPVVVQVGLPRAS